MDQSQGSNEVINALKEKIDKYEKILAVILQKPKLAGVVVAGPHNKMYRVTSGDERTLFIVPKPDEKANVCDYKIGDSILCNEDLILHKMPEELEVKKIPPKFTFLQWDEIGGMKSQISEIRKSVEMPLDNAALYAEYGAKPIKGLLLYGPPGCGKTLIAKAIATTILGKMKEPNESSFVYIKGPELLSMYVGATEQHIKRIFSSCRTHKMKTGVRSVVFIDEAEALLPERGSMMSSDVEKTIVPMFLSEMDGFDNEHAPFIILATNKPKHVDNAILREGRIDLKIKVGRPTVEDAVEIFDIYLKKTKTIEDNISKKAAKLLFERVSEHAVSGSLISTTVQLAIENAISRKIEADKSSKKNAKIKQIGVGMPDIIYSINKILNHELESKVLATA